MTRTLQLALVVLVALAGCNNGHDGLTVNGTVTAARPGLTSSFDFRTDTKLYYDDATNPPGVTSGHCTITRGTGTTPDTLNFGVTRPSTVMDNGVSQLVIRVDDPHTSTTIARGAVTATFGMPGSTGASTYIGGPGAGCDFTVDYDAQAKAASFTFPTSCTLTGTTDTATLQGSLQYYVCTVL